MRILLGRFRVVLCAGILLYGFPAWAQTPQTPPPPAPDPTLMPSVASLFTELPADAKRIPTLTNSLWLAGTGALSASVHVKDDVVTRSASSSSAWDAFFDSGATMGGGLVQIGGAVGTYVVGRVAQNPKAGQLGADLIRAQILDTVMTQGIKVAVDRRRPDGTRYSFPSGHSSSSFATATVLARHFGWKVGMPAYAMATYVAGSRLTENKHFLSDVIFGAGIGIVSGRAVTVGRGAHRFALAPMAAPGAIGLGLTRVTGQ